MIMIKNGDIGDKYLPKTCFMHEKPPFIVEKKGLNSYKSISFIVNNTVFVLLAGGKEKNGRKQKTEKRNRFWERKERKSSSDFGEGDPQC